MAALPDKKAILNKALLLIGSGRVLATADDADSADAANLLQLWDIARRAALALHPWNFALGRKPINRDVKTATDGGPAYRFKLPPDCVRWLPWDRDNSLWFDAVEEGGLLLSDNEGPIVLRYITDHEDVAQWSPLFVDVMAHQLALEYCQLKAQTMGLRDRLQNNRDGILADAKQIDGRQSPNQPRPSVRQSRWAGARYRPNFGRY